MAKDNETFGVGMAPETATLDSGIRQPSVNYQATVRMPDVNISTGDVKLPSTDWASYALNEGNRLLQGYEKWQESDAKAKAAAAKQAEDEADMAQRNALARAINKIEAGRRQGLYNNTVAESMLRDLEDQAIASGMDEDTVTKVRKNRQTDILSLETERRKAEQSHEINVSNELDNELIKKYPVTATMTKAERLNYITRADKAVTTYQNMEREKRLYPVDSDEYKIRDALQAQAAEEDAEINLCLKISQAINADKKITPETLAALKEEAVNYYTYNFGMNPTKAAILIDRIYQLRGADTMQQNYIDSNKLHIEALEDAIKTADLEVEYKMYSFPFYTQMKHMYGDKFKEYAADYAERNGIIDTFSRYFAINAGLAAETLDDKGRPTLNTGAIGDAIKGMNNLYAAPSITTPYQRSVTALEVFRSLNNNNSVANATSERDVKIANNNLKEAKNRMDYDAIRKDAEGLLKSEDPFMSKLGRVTIEELDRAEGQEIASDFRMPNSPMYQTVNSLLSSLNAGEIKYDESGKAFLSGTSGVFGEIAAQFRGKIGEGSYETLLERLNKSLEDLTPEIRKSVMGSLGFEKAQRGDINILEGGMLRDPVRRSDWYRNYQKSKEWMPETTVDEVTGEELNALPPSTVDEVTGEEIYNGQKMSSSYSKTFDMTQPFVYKGNIDLDERPVYDNGDDTISTEESIVVGHDGKYYVIPTIRTENGKRVDMTEDEADEYFLKTGEHLGEYDNIAEAEEASEIIHNRFENPGIAFDPVNKRMVDPRDLRQDFGDTSISHGQTPARLEDFHKDLLISQETLGKKPNLTVYKDSLKHDTIGYGHKLTDAEKASGKFKGGISEEEAWEMFVKDYAQAVKDVDSILKEKDISYIPEEARLVLVNMAYNMGKGYVDEKGKKKKGLKSFVKMFDAIKNGDVGNIIYEMIDSDWYKQVPNRANELIKLMAQAYK